MHLFAFVYIFGLDGLYDICRQKKKKKNAEVSLFLKAEASRHSGKVCGFAVQLLSNGVIWAEKQGENSNCSVLWLLVIITRLQWGLYKVFDPYSSDFRLTGKVYTDF